MAGLVTHWERRDGADREALGQAAFALCRATRQVDGVKSSRFFWTGPDQVVILSEANTMADFDQASKPDQAEAIFALSDLARATATERWIDPRDGTEAYRVAGR
jgi:hypothetical protein